MTLCPYSNAIADSHGHCVSHEPMLSGTMPAARPRSVAVEAGTSDGIVQRVLTVLGLNEKQCRDRDAYYRLVTCVNCSAHKVSHNHSLHVSYPLARCMRFRSQSRRT